MTTTHDKIGRMLSEVARLTEAQGSFSLDWNDQRAYYMSVEQELAEKDDWYSFENDSERQRAIQQNTLVGLQWYPRTPISFVVMHAPDLEALADWVLREIAGGDLP